MVGLHLLRNTLAVSLVACTTPPTRSPRPIPQDGEPGEQKPRPRPRPPAPPDAQHVREVRPAIVAEWDLALMPGEVVLETRNLTPATARPVLHLVDARGRQVAMDRPGRGTNARIEYRVPSNDTGGPSPGPGQPPGPKPPWQPDPDRPRPQPKVAPDADGDRDPAPAPRVQQLPPGGNPPVPPTPSRYTLILRSENHRVVRCSVHRDGRTLHSAAQVGAGSPQPFSRLRKDEVLETVRLPGSSQGPHAIYIMESDGMAIAYRGSGGGLAGAARIRIRRDMRDRDVLFAVPRMQPDDRLRVVHNDAALSDHDTDGDGLGARLERDLGTCRSKQDTALGFDCGQVADPRDTDGDGLRDDWEVLGRRELEPAQPLALWGADPRHKDIFIELDFMQREPNEAAVTIGAAYVRRFAELYQDEVRPLSRQEREHRARSLQNPDGEPGISIHMDIGEDPPDGAPADDWELYGDWGGGYDEVPPVRDEDGEWVGADAKDVWSEQMAQARHGVFHYALGYDGGGGQCGHHVPYCNFPLGNADVAAHEFGHTLGLGHSGPAFHGSADPNCKPNYPTLMSYAYLDRPGVGFHDGRGRPMLNNGAVRERGVVPPANSQYLDDLEDLFRYRVDRNAGHVDWNRDGEFSSGTVQAYVNFMPGRGCEWTRYNRLWVGDGAVTVGSPSLVRLDDTLFVVYATPPGALRYGMSSDAFDCPEPGERCAGSSFRVMPALRSGVQALDAVAIREDGQDVLLVVATGREDGRLREFRYELQRPRLPLRRPRLVARGAPRLIRTGSGDPIQAGGSPALAVEPTGQRVHLVYKLRRGNELYASLRADDGTWSDPQAVGAPAMQWRASPSLLWMPRSAALEGSLPQGLYGAFADGDGRPRLWRRDAPQGTWSEVNAWEQDGSGQPIRPAAITGAPALAFVPGQGTGRADRLYLVYIRESDHEVRMSFSFVPESGSPAVHVGLDSPFDNSWHEAYGVDLLFEPGHDTHLRYVAALRHDRDDARNARLRFRPKADGLTQYDLVGWNDWEILGVDSCRTLAPHARGSGELDCPAWRW